MGLQNRTRKIDPEILSSSDAILDDIAERLGLSRVVSPWGNDEPVEKEIDPEVAGLRGSLYPGLSTREIPLEDFRVDELAPVSRPRIDSFAPLTPPSLPPEPERGPARRTAPTVLGYAVAAGLAAFVTVGAIGRARQEAPPAAAPALAAAARPLPAGAAPAPERVALVQDPAPAAEAAAVPAGEAAPPPAAPRSSSRPARVAARATSPAAAAAPAAAAPAVAAAPTPAAEADLPLVLPPPPPKPQIAFDRPAAAVAIAGGGVRAASCRGAGAGAMTVPVRVTFAPSGRAAGAAVTGGPLLGTAEGACVAAALRGAHVPAFDGEPVIVNTAVHLR